MNEFQPSRRQTDLAEVVEMLLDKGIVINADIAVSIGDTQLLGVQIRAAIASFETAAKYGLEFPEGTDMRRLAAAAGDPSLANRERPDPTIAPTRGVNVTPGPDEETADGDSVTNGGDVAGGTGEEQTGNESPETAHPGVSPDPESPPGEEVDIFEGGPLDSEDEATDSDGSDVESEEES